MGCVVISAVFSLSLQFCGSTIAGLCLLSDSIMRLVKEDATNEWLDLLLPRYSLYILRFSITPGSNNIFVFELTLIMAVMQIE